MLVLTLYMVEGGGLLWCYFHSSCSLISFLALLLSRTASLSLNDPGGFLSYKVSFLLMLYDAYKPGADEGKKMSSRPVLAEVEDVTKDVDFKNPRVKNLKF